MNAHQETPTGWDGLHRKLEGFQTIFPDDKEQALALLRELKNDLWVDQSTQWLSLVGMRHRGIPRLSASSLSDNPSPARGRAYVLADSLSLEHADRRLETRHNIRALGVMPLLDIASIYRIVSQRAGCSAWASSRSDGECSHWMRSAGLYGIQLVRAHIRRRANDHHARDAWAARALHLDRHLPGCPVARRL